MCKSPSRLNGLLVSTEARVSAGTHIQNGAQLSKAKAQWTVSKGAMSRPPCLGPSPKALAFSLVTQPSFVSQYPNNNRDRGRGGVSSRTCSQGDTLVRDPGTGLQACRQPTGHGSLRFLLCCAGAGQCHLCHRTAVWVHCDGIWLTGSAWRLEHRNIRQQPRARPAPRPRPSTLLGGWDRARCRPAECARVCVCTHTRVCVRPAGPRHRPAASVSHSTAVPGPGGPRVPTSSPSQPRMPDGGRQRPGPQSGLWLRTVLPSSALSVSA